MEVTVSAGDRLRSGGKMSSGPWLDSRSNGGADPAPAPMGGTSNTGIPDDNSCKTWNGLLKFELFELFYSFLRYCLMKKYLFQFLNSTTTNLWHNLYTTIFWIFYLISLWGWSTSNNGLWSFVDFDGRKLIGRLTLFSVNIFLNLQKKHYVWSDRYLHKYLHKYLSDKIIIKNQLNTINDFALTLFTVTPDWHSWNSLGSKVWKLKS